MPESVVGKLCDEDCDEYGMHGRGSLRDEAHGEACERYQSPIVVLSCGILRSGRSMVEMTSHTHTLLKVGCKL
jgi:hypothetical protein